MSSFSVPRINRKRGKSHAWWRWAILLSAALAAVCWRTQTAISTVPARSRGALDDLAADVRRRLDGKLGGDTSAVTVADRPESEDSAEPPGRIGADEDEQGTFRPTRIEPDDYGVAVTDNAPAGLEGGSRWVKGDGSATCPDEHPIKGNASSRIYHLPGESSYARTIPQICFATEDDAKSAGFRARAR